jgi:hypothetical protein
MLQEYCKIATRKWFRIMIFSMNIIKYFVTQNLVSNRILKTTFPYLFHWSCKISVFAFYIEEQFCLPGRWMSVSLGLVSRGRCVEPCFCFCAALGCHSMCRVLAHANNPPSVRDTSFILQPCCVSFVQFTSLKTFYLRCFYCFDNMLFILGSLLLICFA